MKRSITAMAIVLIIASLGVGYVVGRSGGGDTGDSISSRLGELTSAAPSAHRSASPLGTPALGTPVPGTPALGTPVPGTPTGVATPEQAVVSGTPIAAPALTTPVTATTPLPAGATPPTTPALPVAS